MVQLHWNIKVIVKAVTILYYKCVAIAREIFWDFDEPIELQQEYSLLQ